MKTTKRILAILLTVVVIATMFIGCKKEDSEAVNGTTEPITEETITEIPEEITEDVSVDTAVTDDEGNKTITGTDTDGNTVEIKTDKDGNVTKTVTDKDTGKKTESTTKVVTKPAETTTKKDNGGSKQPTKPETTTKKQNQTTTSTPVKNTTTEHSHNWKATYKTEDVYETKRVKVKDAYDEPVYRNNGKEVEAYYCGGCYMELIQASVDYGMVYMDFHFAHNGMEPNPNVPLCPKNTGKTNWEMNVAWAGDEVGKPNRVKIQTGTIHHDAVYEDKKVKTGTKQVLTGYKCSCGATKGA